MVLSDWLQVQHRHYTLMVSEPALLTCISAAVMSTEELRVTCAQKVARFVAKLLFFKTKVANGVSKSVNVKFSKVG